MASRLDRKFLQLFGHNFSAGEMAQFGSTAAGSTVYTGNIDLIQALAAWQSGWESAVLGGAAPSLQDLNSFCFVIGYELAYLFQEGIPEWNTDTTYFIGSVVQVAGVYYRSLVDTNLGNAVTDGTKWGSIDGDVQSKSADYTILVSDNLIKTTGAIVVTLPDATLCLGKRFTIKKMDSSGTAMIVDGHGSQTIDGNLNMTLNQQYTFVTVQSDGSNFLIVAAG